MSPHEVRGLNADEAERLVDWAAAEGWNPGSGDAAAFRLADRDGLLGAFSGGEMVAGISAIAYGRSYGFIGLYIVRPDMRGRGYGRAVWQHGMARLAGRVVGLDGVDAQVDNYRSMGFEAAYRTVRFGGRFRGRQARTGTANAVPLGASHFPEVAALDSRTFPAARTAFLRRWLAPPHIVRVVQSASGRVTGYGVARRCRTGWKIGGLSAVDDATALLLVEALAADIDDDLYIDVPAPRKAFIDALTARGLTPGFETTRMYAGGLIPLAPELFGVTTLELG